MELVQNENNCNLKFFSNCSRADTTKRSALQIIFSVSDEIWFVV